MAEDLHVEESFRAKRVVSLALKQQQHFSCGWDQYYQIPPSSWCIKRNEAVSRQGYGCKKNEQQLI
jgi:hypothetical protein